MPTFQFQLSQLAEGLDVAIKGDPNCIITGICTLTDPKPQHLTFLINSVYRKHLQDTCAAAVILSPNDAEYCTVNAIISDNPHYTFARIARYFETKNDVRGEIHPSVIFGKNCEIAPSANIAANCVIGNDVKIASDVVIGAGCIIGDKVAIGCHSRLDAHVSVYDNVAIGERSHLSSGVVIGSDGFGFANKKNERNKSGVWHRVPQLGGVIIGDDVSIGANTCIDRGAVGDTVIEDGVKLDNLIQIAHNVQIGADTIIAACVGISGSTTIGKNCMIGGASNFAGHISVCDNVMITGMSAVTKSITEPGMYSSGIVGVVSNHEFRKNNARFHRLGQLMERVKNIEHTLKERV